MFRDHVHRWFSPSVFTLIALFFVLPFATATNVGGCEGSNYNPGTTSFTGIQLVTRAVPLATGADNQRAAKAITSDVEHREGFAADVAFAAALLGLVLGLFGVSAGPGWCAAVGLGAVLQLPFTIGDEYEWDSHVGYWLILGGFAAAGILHFLFWANRTRARGGREPVYWLGVGAGIIALNYVLYSAGLALRWLVLVPILLAIGAAIFLYVRRWRARKRLGVANRAGYWELVVAGSLAIYASLIVGILIHALWAVPLIWAGLIALKHAAKAANAEPKSGTLP